MQTYGIQRGDLAQIQACLQCIYKHVCLLARVNSGLRQGAQSVHPRRVFSIAEIAPDAFVQPVQPQSQNYAKVPLWLAYLGFMAAAKKYNKPVTFEQAIALTGGIAAYKLLGHYSSLSRAKKLALVGGVGLLAFKGPRQAIFKGISKVFNQETGLQVLRTIIR